MKAGSGHSDDADGLAAALAAVDQGLAPLEGETPTLVFLFCTYHHIDTAPEILESVVERAGTNCVVGCTGMGILSERGETEHRPGVSVLCAAGSFDVCPFLVEAEDPVQALRSEFEEVSIQDSVLIILPDIFAYNPTELVASLSAALGNVPIAGGAAAGNPRGGPSLQWWGRKISEHGVSGVLIGSGARGVTAVAQGCRPFGQAYAITAAEGNVIHEIAFSPASEALAEALETLTPAERESVGPSVFAGLAMDELTIEKGQGDFLIRNLIGRDPATGAIAVGERVEVGQTLQFNLRTPEAAHEDLELAVANLATATLEDDRVFGLYFNCLGRGYGLYSQPDHDVRVIRKHLGPMVLTGFFGNAEFAPIATKNFVHNYTGALVLFVEGSESDSPNDGGREIGS